MHPETRAGAASFPLPRLGAGIGLRTKHHAAALTDGAPLPDFFEVVTENFLGAGGRPREVLVEAAKRRPIALHGVSLSIGSTDPLDFRYLDRVAALVERVKPAIVSDHLCWTSHGGRHSHDLLPLRFTEHEADRIASRVADVQARLGVRILLENVSSYLAWRGSTMTEWAFLTAIAERADAGILLDVNNVFVSARNHAFDAREYLRGIPAGRVGQIHLAGHQDRGAYLFDTHDAPVPDPVWALYEEALAMYGPIATLIERDDKLPPYDELLAEAARARTLLDRISTVPPSAASEPRPTPFASSEPRPDNHRPPIAEHAHLFAALSEGATGVLAEIDPAGLVPTARVEIYASSYRARLHDALREDFSATDAFLGHERFHALALLYARAYPSTSPDLGDFGAGFATFLDSHDKTASDLAALEWARTEAFDAADGVPLAMRALAQIPPERWPALRLTPHPSLRFVSMRSRVDAIWKAADAGVALPSAEPATGVIRVWREGTTVFHAWMSVPESAALSALARGEPLESAAGILAAARNADPDAAAATLAAHLRDWVGDGLFVDAN